MDDLVKLVICGAVIATLYFTFSPTQNCMRDGELQRTCERLYSW